jgi:type I restriction enzyme, S subunit
LHAHEYIPEGVPVVSTESIKDRKIDRGSLPHVSKRKARELARHLLNEGDILFARRGVQATGHSALVGAGDRGMLCGTGAIRLRLKADNEIVDPAYLSWVLADQRSISWFKFNAIGGTMPNLNPSIVRAFEFLAPPISEQRAAAEALNDVDALLIELDRLIAKKRDLKQAAMQQLLTGQTRLPGFSGEWEVKRLGDLSGMKSGVGITSDSIDDHSKYPCYGGNGIRGFTSRYTHSGRYALVGRQGALCGNVSGVEGSFFASEHAIVVTAFQGTDIQWLTYVLRQMNLNQHTESSAQPGLSVAKILNLEVECPLEKAEQTAIATVLSDMDAELDAVEQRRAKTAALKQGMMQELLTGRTRLV